MTVIWNDNLKTGIAAIDEQHQLLFEIIGMLEESIEDKAQFYEVLIKLQNYMTEHFKTEEDYMKHTSYPEFGKHKACHEKFAEDYKKILHKSTESNNLMDLAPELISFAETWLTGHYENEDVKMAAHLNKCRLNN